MAAERSTRDELLALLRAAQGELISGTRLSRSLGLSRTAVWKQIRSLEELGYSIEAVPSRGYRLTAQPDLLRPADILEGLDTRTLGARVLCFEEIESTNTALMELAEQGAPEGTVLIAGSQSAGRGRMGRPWSSPPGVNLYLSVLLKPSILPGSAPHLTFVSSLAAALALREHCGLDARVKWPNDILVGGRKIAGLLNEMQAETDKLKHLVLGLGINLNMRPEQFPADLRYPATSVLMEQGRAVRRLEFTRALLEQLDGLYQSYRRDGFAPIASAWSGLCDLAGRRVQVDQQSRLLTGDYLGLDADGALLLRLDDGSRTRILSGDVRPC